MFLNLINLPRKKGLKVYSERLSEHEKAHIVSHNAPGGSPQTPTPAIFFPCVQSFLRSNLTTIDPCLDPSSCIKVAVMASKEVVRLAKGGANKLATDC